MDKVDERRGFLQGALAAGAGLFAGLWTRRGSAAAPPFERLEHVCKDGPVGVTLQVENGGELSARVDPCSVVSSQAGGQDVVRMELLLDGLGTKSDVAQQAAQIVRLSLVDADKHRPPLVMFTWGAHGLPPVQGIIVQALAGYTMFLPDGKPCRATVLVEVAPA